MTQDHVDVPGPTGTPISVPCAISEPDPYRSLETPDQMAAYYEREGYVVCRGLIPRQLCDEAREAFLRQVKPFNGLLYRQATANLERHRFTTNGFMVNSILNVQDLDVRSFGNFRDRGLAIITHANVRRVVEAIAREPSKVVQTMFFEGNPATWAHQDTYYLDSAEIGRMAAAWFAIEDIQPEAGRFYVYPRSHQIDMVRNGGDFDIAFNHDRYKRLVVNVIDKHQLECRAPALRKGDVLFWAAKTIHGSLQTTRPDQSRCSFTAHFIPQSTDFLQYQTRRKRLRLRTFNAMAVHHPKDQNERLNRAIAAVEGRFPRAFQTAKKVAVKILTR